MAYMTVRLSAGSYNPTTNSTSVSATVYITWNTSQSYDQDNKAGTLTIGAYSTTFSTNYNASRESSGTQIVGGGSTTIYHNSNGDPVQVTANASSLRYSASDTITLPGGTPSGGSSGGSSGGGDSGGDEPQYCWFNINQGDNTTITVYQTNDGTAIQNGWGVRKDIQVCIRCDVAAGYKIQYFEINGTSYQTGQNIYMTLTSDNIHIRSKAISESVCIVRYTLSSNAFGDMFNEDTGYSLYTYEEVAIGSLILTRFEATPGYDLTIYINNKIVEHDLGRTTFIASGDTVIEVKATLVGEGLPDTESDSINQHSRSNCVSLGLSNDGEIYGNNILYFSLTDREGYVKFRTPADLKTSNYIIFDPNFFKVDENGDTQYNLIVSLQESEVSTSIIARSTTRGDYIVGSSTFRASYKLSTTVLERNTEYCIHLKFTSTPSNQATASLGPSPPMIYIDYIPFDGIIKIDNGVEFVPYEIYIDNGTGWDLYKAYIDNGTNWEIYS